MEYTYQLERYNGRNTRYNCPSCGGKREFTRYINKKTGEYLNERVGMCNRISHCKYHYPPKDFFLDNPSVTFQPIKPSYTPVTPVTATPVQYLPIEYMEQSTLNFDMS